MTSKQTCHVGLLSVALWGCSATHGEPSPAARPTPVAFPVQLAAVNTQDVEYTLAAVGSLQAYEHVPITARVPGVVERVLFMEGDRVKRGQVLVEIEVDRYVLEVKAAQAALERVQAALEEAVAGVQRRESDTAQSLHIIPHEELQLWRTRAKTLGAETRQAQVSLEHAQLNLRDARLRAPEAGIIQSREARTGQYVTVGSQLAGLLRRDPLLLRFDVPEGDAARITQNMALRFHLRDSQRTFMAHTVHVAAAASEASRMVAVVATVDDSTNPALRPGAFAEVTIPVGAAAAAPTVPLTAVRASERGFLAYVVEGNIAHERRLQLGLRTADGQVEVQEGLKVGEQLVVRGVEALRDGATIKVKTLEASDTNPEAGEADLTQ